MGGIVKSIFGGGSSSASIPKVDLNREFRSGRSRLQGGQLTLDPYVSALRSQYIKNTQGLLGLSPALANFGGQYSALGTQLAQEQAGLPGQIGGLTSDVSGLASQFGGLAGQSSQQFGGVVDSFGKLANEFAGNQGALINARLNPLRQQIASGRGALEQNLSRRGVQGTFANQARQAYDFDAGRALGDAGAQATADALNARTGLTQAQQSALGQQFGLQSGLLGQQLGALGQQANLYGLQSGLAGTQAQQQAGLLGQELGAEQANIQNQVLLNQLLGGAQGNLFQQELAGLGLGADSIAALLGAQSSRINAATERRGQDKNILGSVLGAAGSYFLSDRRLKSNIQKVGQLDNGLNVYEYDIFGKRETGVMADEVEQVMPDAVKVHPSGYKMVDYARIT